MIDVDRIAQPVPGNAPAGPSLRYDRVFDEIKESRREDDASLPQGVWQSDLKTANWRKVADLCEKALEKSKDLQLCVWLVEAGTHQYGLEGLKASLQGLDAVCRNYWDTLWPEIDDIEDEDYESRILAFEWLNRQLVKSVLISVEVTDPSSPMEQPFSLLDWRQIARLPPSDDQKKASKDKKGDEESPLTRARFDASAAATPTEFFEENLEHLDAAIAVLRELGSLLDDKMGRSSPSFREPLGVMQEIRGILAEVLDSRAPEPEPEAEPEPAFEAADEAAPRSAAARPAAAAGPVAQPIRTRDDAYEMLGRIADFLQQREPHSPVPYLLRRAIAFKDMTFTDLLGYLVDDDRQRVHLFKLLGVFEPGEDKKDDKN